MTRLQFLWDGDEYCWAQKYSLFSIPPKLFAKKRTFYFVPIFAPNDILNVIKMTLKTGNIGWILIPLSLFAFQRKAVTVLILTRFDYDQQFFHRQRGRSGTGATDR